MATDDEQLKRDHGERLRVAMSKAGVLREVVATATDRDVKTVTNWTKGRRLPSDHDRAILRKLFPGYDDQGDPVEVAIGRSDLTEDRKLEVRAFYLRKVREQFEASYATRSIAGVLPAAPADATKMTGMKLGTGTTAAAKNGVGAALVTYLTGSNVAFDATFPSTSNLGAGLGVNAVYKTTWPAGTATNAAITEAVIVNDSATNLTSTAANTISRVVFTAVNKGAADTLAITWNHKYLGA